MQRVVSIHLNGNVYQIEENGYNALFGFLDATETALQNDADRAQKLADLERVLAERCQACLSPHKTVVTSVEIDRILVELGHAVPPAPAPAASYSSGSTSSASSSSTASSNQTSSHPSPHKRLFQIREGAMISGVCVGLSEFLHLDVTLIRVLFVVFALVTSGWGMLAYGLLMFLVPKVDTRADASSGAVKGTTPPHHWPWDDGWPWDKHGWPWDHHPWPWEQPRTTSPQAQTPPQQGAPSQPGAPSQASAQQAPPPPDPRQAWRDSRQEWRDKREEWRAQRREWRDQRRAAYGPSGPHPFSTIPMIVFLMIGFFWLSFWSRGHFFFGFPFFWGFPHWFGIVFFFVMLRMVFMPFRASRWHGYGPYGPYSHPHYAWASMWNGFAWFMVMIFAVWFAFRYIPEIHEMFSSVRL